VLVVDDSALMRRLLTDLLSRDPRLEVVGAAADPYIARNKILKLQPDVLTLDVEMPRMDGLTFLEKLMRVHPMPVVMVSALTQSGAETTLQALELGAVDFVTKPRLDLVERMADTGPEIAEKVKTAAVARLRPATPGPERPQREAPALRPTLASLKTTQRVIAVGASTGGFTDCLLAHGALKVFAVDVGYGQLDWKLRIDPRVVIFEKTNIRYLDAGQLPRLAELATIDVSFISLRLVLPRVKTLLVPESEIIALIKPQFEVGKGKVGKGGVVRSHEEHGRVIGEIKDAATALGFAVRGVTESRLVGPKGNKEFFIYLTSRLIPR